jgi:hypothetical protein
MVHSLPAAIKLPVNQFFEESYRLFVLLENAGFIMLSICYSENLPLLL